MKIKTKKIKRILVLEKRYSNALTPLSWIIFSSDYFFQSFCNIWVSVTPSDNSFTISPHNLALLHSTLLHSYPVPLKMISIYYFEIQGFVTTPTLCEIIGTDL